MASGLRRSRLGRGYALRGEEGAEDQEREDRQRGAQALDARVLVGGERGVGLFRAHAGLVESALEVRVGDERNAPGELHLRLRLRTGRNVRALLDVRREGEGDRADQD